MGDPPAGDQRNAQGRLATTPVAWRGTTRVTAFLTVGQRALGRRRQRGVPPMVGSTPSSALA